MCCNNIYKDIFKHIHQYTYTVYTEITAQFQHIEIYTGTDGFPVSSYTLMDFLLLKRSSVPYKPRIRGWIPKGKSKPKTTAIKNISKYNYPAPLTVS